MPGASVYAGRACGSHVEGNWKIVLHSTEGSTASGNRNYNCIVYMDIFNSWMNTTN